MRAREGGECVVLIHTSNRPTSDPDLVVYACAKVEPMVCLAVHAWGSQSTLLGEQNGCCLHHGSVAVGMGGRMCTNNTNKMSRL
jgi:hypothetical protein